MASKSKCVDENSILITCGEAFVKSSYLLQMRTRLSSAPTLGQCQVGIENRVNKPWTLEWFLSVVINSPVIERFLPKWIFLWRSQRCSRYSLHSGTERYESHSISYHCELCPWRIKILVDQNSVFTCRSLCGCVHTKDGKSDALVTSTGKSRTHFRLYVSSIQCWAHCVRARYRTKRSCRSLSLRCENAVSVFHIRARWFENAQTTTVSIPGAFVRYWRTCSSVPLNSNLFENSSSDRNRQREHIRVIKTIPPIQSTHVLSSGEKVKRIRAHQRPVTLLHSKHRY